MIKACYTIQIEHEFEEFMKKLVKLPIYDFNVIKMNLAAIFDINENGK